MPKKIEPLDVGGEYRDVDLGDARRDERLKQVVRRLESEPSASFPVAMVTQRELEGFYRLVNNEKVTAAALLAPHFAASRQRVREHDEQVLVVHDTSEFRYAGERVALGRLTRTGRGFLGHFALAISAQENGDVLGVLGLEMWKREGESLTAQRLAGKISYAEARAGSEQTRWWRMVKQVEDSLGAHGTSVVHLMDSEGDDYSAMTSLVGLGLRFVIRAKQDRCVLSEKPGAKMLEVVTRARVVAERTATLSRRRRRPDHKRKRGQPRDEREAQLSIRARQVVLRRPPYAREAPVNLNVNVVMVREVNPPKGFEPVEWVLLTSEPIGDQAEVLRIVDAYRRRWVIEEYFKALKTGCSAEKRQADGWGAMQNVLALLAPIAWSLLRLRSLARTSPDVPAHAVLTLPQIEVLRAASETKLPKKPTVGEAMLAIARLGGHLRSNGAPGWLVLGRGYDRLLTLEVGYRLARGDVIDA